MIITGGVEFYNQKFIDTMEHMDPFIQNRVRQHPDIWFDRVPKGVLTPFEGLTRKTNIFHGGLLEQSGLTNWKQIQTSRKPNGADSGHDACAITPKTFDYAWETMQYTGYEASWQSEPICLKDIVHIEQGREQCGLITSFLSALTHSVWANWNHEKIVHFSVLAGNAHILTPEGPEYSSNPFIRFHYDPNVVDANGDTYILFPAEIPVSTLNMSYLDFWQDYLGDQCPEAAIANTDGIPEFGWVGHKRDFRKALMEDTDIRADLRAIKDKSLVDGYKNLTSYDGWPVIHDLRQMRFKYTDILSSPTYGGESLTGSYVKAVRVEPMRRGPAVTIGNKPEANPDYATAEFAIAPIFMNKILQNLIPGNVENPGGGHIFGAVPGTNGDFMWINEYDRELNPRKLVGYFLAAFEAFPKPLMFAQEQHTMLYARCTQRWLSECAQHGATETAGSSDAVGIATDAVAADVDATLGVITLTLEKRLNAGVTAAISLLDDDGAEVTGYIAQAQAEPTYVFAIASGTLSAHGKYTAAGASTVTLA